MCPPSHDDPDDGPLPTQTIRRPELRRLVRRPGRVKLRILDGPDAGREAVIDRTKIRVGRSGAADVRVDHDSMSGLHFELRLGSDGVEVIDMASKNGTMLLGRRVYHACIQPGDVIVAGACRIELVETGDVAVEQSVEAREDGLLGISPSMQEMFALLDKVARREIPVLVTGESGTGKDVLVRALHRRSQRSRGPLIVLDCGALAQSLAETALFGHRKGAFTGANEDRPGVFEEAEGGTLFIDEIGELPLALQVKLLRALEAGQVTRVGDSTPRRVDARVVAATHRDLRRMVADGQFREDLYFRLARFVIELPPLRERGPEEIAYLANNILAGIMQNEGLSVQLGQDGLAALQRYSWPGNVRELRNELERAALRCNAGVITADDMPLGERQPRNSQIVDMLFGGSYDEAHDKLDRLLIPRILDEVDGNISEAARRLDVGRKKLTSRMKALGLYSPE
jgi:DNA-binding NtrC family response regulator